MILTINVEPSPVFAIQLPTQRNISIIGTPGLDGPQGEQGASGPAGSITAVANNIAQSGHGFSVGNVLRIQNTSTTYLKAQANNAANAEVVGIVSVVIDSNNFTMISSGRITGLSGLTKGTVYFLSDATAGLLTATEPTPDGTKVSKPLLIADSTTSGYFMNQRGLIRNG